MKSAGRLFIAVLLGAGAAEGNFASSVEFLGFSENGGYFAWEQYGVQDGSGFPFSSVTVQETEGGAVVWSRRIMLEDDRQDLERARETCRMEARKAMAGFSSVWLPGFSASIIRLPTCRPPAIRYASTPASLRPDTQSATGLSFFRPGR